MADIGRTVIPPLPSPMTIGDEYSRAILGKLDAILNELVSQRKAQAPADLPAGEVVLSEPGRQETTVNFTATGSPEGIAEAVKRDMKLMQASAVPEFRNSADLPSSVFEPEPDAQPKTKRAKQSK